MWFSLCFFSGKTVALVFPHSGKEPLPKISFFFIACHVVENCCHSDTCAPFWTITTWLWPRLPLFGLVWFLAYTGGSQPAVLCDEVQGVWGDSRRTRSTLIHATIWVWGEPSVLSAAPHIILPAQVPELQSIMELAHSRCVVHVSE